MPVELTNSVIFNSIGIRFLSKIDLDDSHRKILATNMNILEGFFELPIDSVNWSIRVMNVLRKNGFFKIKHIVENVDRLIRIRDFGATSYKEVKEKLAISLKKYINTGDYNNYKPCNEHIFNDRTYICLTTGVLGTILKNKDDMLFSLAKNPYVLDKFLNTPIDTINWSVRCANVFRKIRLDKIKDFTKYNDIKLLKNRNFGKACLKEVYNKLYDYIMLFIKRERIAKEPTVSLPQELLLLRGMLGLVFNGKIGHSLNNSKDPEILNKLLEAPANIIDWSVRVSSVLDKLGIKKVGDFSRIDEQQLLKTRNIGLTSLEEIREKLEKFILIQLSGGIGNLFSQQVGKKIKSCDLEGLVKYLISRISLRERKILCRRHGLWDGKKITLRNVSKQLEITRERVRQIQMAQENKVKKLYRSCYMDSFIEELFVSKLKPFLESNFKIANQSELLQIIYAIDGEATGVDLANEFLSEVIFDGDPIFINYVVKFDNEVVGLETADQEYYLNLVKESKRYLKKVGIPQDIDNLMEYYRRIGLVENITTEKERTLRFLSVSSIPRDSTGKFGLEKWKFFNAYNIHGMAERALLEINQPAHFTQVVLLMNEMFPKQAPFDAHNVHARIGSRKDIFTWVSPGVYGLKRWGLERPPYVKDYIVDILKKANRPLHIDQLTEKVLEKCNCKKSSIGWILGDNPDTFICYSNKLYGLSRWK